MRLLFLNQYGPPDSPPTARLLGELADSLRARGHTVEIVVPARKLRGTPRTRRGADDGREVAGLLHILRAGSQRRHPRPEVVLALSSPPGLAVVGALLALRHRARFAHWAMDLYPELAVALGELPGGRWSGLVRAAMGWAYRRAALVVALDEDMRAHLQPFCRAAVQVMEPWPPPGVENQIASAVGSADPSRRGGRHAVDLALLGQPGPGTRMADAARCTGGARSPGTAGPVGFSGRRCGARTRPRARGEAGACVAADGRGTCRKGNCCAACSGRAFLIVTQRHETQGLLWPSKLALLERLPRPILFVGPVRGAIAGRLRSRERAGVFAPGEAAAVADWIEARFRERTDGSSVRLPPLFPSAAEGCARLERWLEGVC